MADFGITAGPAGLLVASYFVAYGVLQVPAGVLADRVPPRLVLLVAIALLAASNLAFAAAPAIAWAVAARAAVGASSGPVWLTNLKVCATLSLRDYPRRVGLLVTVGSLAPLLTVAGLPLLLSAWGWRTTVVAVLTVPLLLLLPLVGLARFPAASDGERSSLRDLPRALAVQLRSRGFWWLMLPAVAWNGAHFGVLSWLARLARDVLGASPELTGVLPALVSVGLLAGGILFGSLHGRWRKGGRWLFFGGGAAYTLVLVLIAGAAALGIGWLLYLLVPLLGLLFGAFFIWMGLLSELVPRALLGTATGLINGLTFVPAFFDPWIVGTILDLVDRPAAADPTYSPLSFSIGFLVLAGTMIAGLAAGFVVGRQLALAPSGPR